MKVSIVIPSWDGVELLQTCLLGVSDLVDVDPEIIVSDDGSADGTSRFLSERFPSVRVLRQQRRRGFAAAVNSGLRQSSSPYVALLNNDAVPEPRWLAASIQTLQELPDYDVCVPKITYAESPNTINSVGLYLRWYGASGDIGIGEPDGAPYDKRAEVFGFTGCAVLFRRKALDLVGMLDEWLEAYGEDLDWTLRARRVGVRFVYCPDARVRHRGGGTFRRLPDRAVYLQCRNSVVVLARHVPLRSAVRNALGLAAFHVYHVIVNASRGHGLAAVRGTLAGLRHAFSETLSGVALKTVRRGDSFADYDPLRSGPSFRVMSQ